MALSVRLALTPGRPVCDLPSPGGRARCLISLKAAGNMSLGQDERRLALFRSLGLEPARVLALRQVHSTRVLADREARAAVQAGSALPEADGLVSADPAAVLSVTVADCLPIFVADRGTGARGLVHSGWKGTGIVAEAIGRMTSLYGCRPAELSVVIGPGIGPCCYHVPRERYDLFRTRFGAASALERDGRTWLDLRQANVELLAALGVRDVTVVTDCTACTPQLASYRVLGSEDYIGMVALMGSF